MISTKRLRKLLSFILLLLLLSLFVGNSRVLANNSIPANELAEAIKSATAGDTITVDGGIFYGSIVIDKQLTLLGQNSPVIDGGNEGTVVEVTAANTVFTGFEIRNSGASLDEENAGIAIEAENVLVADNEFNDTLFGIYLRSAHGSTIRGNQITGKALDLPRRGDPIRVWYSNDVTLEHNIVTAGRDVVLWYSERLTVLANEVSDGRYGLHFMYCDDATVSENLLLNNSVGTFLMYSRRLTLTNNTIAHNRGPSGFGVGLKDMDDAIIEDNLFLDNRIGAHLDTSPREVDSIGQFSGNLFAYNDIGVGMSPSVRNNHFVANSFIDNEEQVAIDGRTEWQENEWTVAGTGNYWSDYAGYDADGDGRGDIIYKSEQLFEKLTAENPQLRLFSYSPVTNALDLAAKAFPVVRPRPKLEDDNPLMSAQIPAGAPLLPQPGVWRWYGAATLLLLAAGLVILAPGQRRPKYVISGRVAEATG